MTIAVLLASAACYALKLTGYVFPGHWLDGERTSRVLSALPIALLAALIAVQTLIGTGGRVVLDGRIPAVFVAIVLLRLKANFIVVVVASAVVAAVLRAYGLAT
ncbi:MAG: AzlD domain-containing protein [Nostocoides sp.]